MFIEEITRAMEQKKISAYQLEEDLGLSHSTISSWKRGTQPTIEKAIKVIKYLGLSADEIFEIKPVQKTVLMTTMSDSRQVSNDFMIIKSGLCYIRDSKNDIERQDLCEGLLKYMDEALQRHRKNIREKELRKQEIKGDEIE